MRKMERVLDEDPNLTQFQKKVYRAILDIPSGEVRSYKWVASKIGKPAASRAVGQALKRNPYTVIIPCHRVVKADGTIGGYAKGLIIDLRKEYKWQINATKSAWQLLGWATAHRHLCKG